MTTQDFEVQRQHLKALSDEALKERFWELAGEIVDPLMEMAYQYTSPSIERSVLLRMGFSSIEATAIVDQVIKHHLMSKGAGHIVYRLSKEEGLSIRDAGLALADGKHWDMIEKLFEAGE